MWKDEAACRGEGISSWFARRTSQAGKRAVEICSSCPVREQCLDEAMTYEKTDGMRIGIWGGLGPVERSSLRTGDG